METTGVPELGAGAGGGVGDVAPEVTGGAGVGGGGASAPEASGGGDVVPEVIVVGARDAVGRVVALVGALLSELAGLSLDGAGRGVLRGVVAALARVRAGADAAEARVVHALERLDDGGLDAVEVLRRNAGSSQREARRRWRRARALAQMPNVARALAAGDISTEHAEALARAAAATSAEVVDDDAELLAQVAGVPADRAGRYIEAWTQRHQDPFDLQAQHLRQRRRRRLNFGDGEDGMLMAHAAFDRVLGAQFRSLIDGIADRIWRDEGGRDNPNSRSPEQRRLDALAIAVGLEPPTVAQRESKPQPGDEPGPVTPEDLGPRPAAGPLVVTPRHQIVIVASADVISGKDPQGRCEIPGVGPIPLGELERLACDAELFGVLFSGDGEPLWHGRGERTATDAQRRALIARDGGCVLCADEPARCEGHHVEPWAKPSEGPTDIDNLALLCGTCHRRLHNHGRVLRRGPDGTWGTAPDPRFTGRRKPTRASGNGASGNGASGTRTSGTRAPGTRPSGTRASGTRPSGNGARRKDESATSACRLAAFEMTMNVEAQFLTQGVGRTGRNANHRRGLVVASRLGRETTAAGAVQRPGGRQLPGGGQRPGGRQPP